MILIHLLYITSLHVKFIHFFTDPLYSTESHLVHQSFDIYNGFNQSIFDIDPDIVLRNNYLEINDGLFSKNCLQRYKGTTYKEGPNIFASFFYYGYDIIPYSRINTLVNLYFKIFVMFNGLTDYKNILLRKCTLGKYRYSDKRECIKILKNTLTKYSSYTDETRTGYFILFKKVLDNMLGNFFNRKKDFLLFKYIENMNESNIYSMNDDIFSKFKKLNDILSSTFILPDKHIEEINKFTKLPKKI